MGEQFPEQAAQPEREETHVPRELSEEEKQLVSIRIQEEGIPEKWKGMIKEGDQFPLGDRFVSAEEYYAAKREASPLQKHDIFWEGEKIGTFSFLRENEEGGDRQFQGLEIVPEYRGRGIAKEVYRRLNEEAKQSGGILMSDVTVSPDAKRVWESLVRSGEAEKVGPNVYAFKRPPPLDPSHKS